MANEVEENLQFEYNLNDVRIVNFETKIPNTEPENIGYSVEIGHNFDKDAEKLSIRIGIVAKKSKKAKSYYCKLKTETSFSIVEASSIEKLPLDFVLQSISIAYSTTRGVLFAKNEDNFISKHPLALLDMNAVKEGVKSKE